MLKPPAERLGSRTRTTNGARTAGAVVTIGNTGHPAGHDARSRQAIASRLAALLGFAYAGEYDPGTDYPDDLYFVPHDALPVSRARQYGIRCADDLFGGVVPDEFVATKIITHPLVRPDAIAPAGWSHAFATSVASVALRGYSCFNLSDARIAALRLLGVGPVRFKLSTGIGGRGQTVVASVAETDALLATLDAQEVARSGVVVEENLAEVATFSVGQIELRGMVASYCGQQRTIPNNRGQEVYGGSTLHVVRGGFAELEARPLSPEARDAVTRARRYDAAASTCFPRFFASRRNYDVARGTAPDGAIRSGVLEQSWRIGGASGAEVVALERFAADPALQHVGASSVEAYGATSSAPAGAFVYYKGTDERSGPLLKYAVVDSDADAR